MSFVDSLKTIRDLGVPPEMSADEAKYIRLLNSITLVISFFYFITFVFITYLVLFKNAWWIGTLYEAMVVVSFLPVFLFNKWRRYNLARVYFLVIGNTALFVACFIAGEIYLGHYCFFVTAGLAAILHPKKETKWMIAMIGLSMICYFIVKFFVYDYAIMKAVDPNHPIVIIVQFYTELILYISFIAITLIARSGAIGAEDRLKDEREKVTLLSKKLKVYLPHQFVEALADGDRDTEPDYKRRRLTVFFSDVKGFTSWTDKLEPEETRNILNQYLSEMNKIADKWGGTIDKFIGDAIMIFFGDPEYTNDKDHAIRCVKMAMEMQRKMNDLRAEWEDLGYLDPLHIRIGINTGYATVGNFGSENRLNYTVLGRAVNLSSSLETACTPDKITVSHTTYSLIKNEIECEPRGDIEVKGFSEPVKIYEVVKVKSEG